MSAIMDRAREFADAITAAGVPATTRPAEVQALSGGRGVVVLVGPPTLNPGPVGGGWDVVWRPLVVSLDPDAGAALEAVLDAVDVLVGWDRGFTAGRPVSWQPPNGGSSPAFAYEFQYADTIA